MYQYKLVLQKTVLFSVLALAVNSAVALPDRNSLWQVLDYYGFATQEQKDAVLFLMQTSGVKDADNLLHATTDNPEELLSNLITLVQATQEHFVIRKGTQERWDVKTSDWMKDPKLQAKTIAALRILGVIDEVDPQFVSRDVICVLGATKPTMDKRTEYSIKAMPAEELVLLAGKRPVTVDKNHTSIDGTYEYLHNLAATKGKKIDELTETDLIQESYKASAIYGQLPVRVIDTPKGGLPRPTTETTMIALIAWLKENPNFTKITFVSNQPHVAYQRAVIASVLKQHDMSIQFEVVGPEMLTNNPNNFAEVIKQGIGALGSQIYAATPNVVSELDMQVDNEELKRQFADLFSSQPLIYKSAKAVLSI